MTEKVFTGPLNRQLKDALNYIKNYIIKEKISKTKEKAEAIRFFNYPYQAVEEVLCNAMYHKSYQIGEPITVMITPEKMEITSLPGPDRTITDIDLKNYHLVSKRYRNRRIGDFLKELKLIEGRNTGIPTINKYIGEKTERNTQKRRTFQEIKDLILEILQGEGPLPTAVLVDKMNYKKLTDSVSKAIKELMRENRICYEEEKVNSKNQRLMLVKIERD